MLKNGAALALGCAELEFMEMDEQIRKIHRVPDSFGDSPKYRDKCDRIWDAEHLNSLNMHFIEKTEIFEKSLKAFDSEVETIVNENIKNVAVFHDRFFKMVNLAVEKS